MNIQWKKEKRTCFLFFNRCTRTPCILLFEHLEMQSDDATQLYEENVR